jgi:hypothetical protein
MPDPKDEPKADSPRARADAPGKGYSTFEWAGHTRYRCDDCPWDTSYEDLMRTHRVEFNHADPGAPLRPTG